MAQKVLRWLAVLPGSIIAYIIFYYLNKVSTFAYLNPENHYFKVGLEAFFNWGGGFAFVFGGALIAPNHRKFVGVVLSIVLTLIIVGFFNHTYNENQQVIGIIYSIAIVVGGVGACIALFSNNEPAI